MPVRSFRPTSPGRRFMTVADFAEVTKSEPEKSLLAPLHNRGGRNNRGRITTRHQGGGHKRRYRVIDFRRTKDGVPAKVAAIEYDPNRSARIALLHYADGAKAYILAPHRLQVGADARVGPGGRHPPRQLPAAGVDADGHHGARHRAAARTGREDGPLGRRRARSSSPRRAARRSCACPPASCAACRTPAAPRSARSGTRRTRTSPAARPDGSRWQGKRPTVRGTAMNPVDHPHGGGEGKNKGSHPVTPWGKPTLGRRTRDPKKASSTDIVRGRRRGKGRK